MARKKKPRGQRTFRESIHEKFSRVGAIARGREPGSSPVTLPESATPRIKPKGTTRDKKGRRQYVERSHDIVERSRKKSRQKKK